jgi:hypothetical protein
MRGVVRDLVNSGPDRHAKEKMQPAQYWVLKITRVDPGMMADAMALA